MSDEEHGITRDPETGRIVKKVLTSEQAREIGSQKYKKKREKSSEQLLLEAGYESKEDAPEHLVLLSTMATTNHHALNAFIKLTRGEQQKEQDTPGCPHWDDCTYYNLIHDRYTADEKQQVLAAAKARLKARGFDA